MAAPREPVFLERQNYRRRRLMDAARLLPWLGAAVFAAPPIWGAAGSTALRGLYVFAVWAALIAAAFILSRRLVAPASEGPEGGAAAPDPDPTPRRPGDAPAIGPEDQGPGTVGPASRGPAGQFRDDHTFAGHSPEGQLCADRLPADQAPGGPRLAPSGGPAVRLAGAGRTAPSAICLDMHHKGDPARRDADAGPVARAGDGTVRDRPAISEPARPAAPRGGRAKESPGAGDVAAARSARGGRA
ncbi:hypothetical protein [Mesobaculum littorinae]|uniref:hypothetical protein n=1 Tax=Mesobaculum littorinae TaxID=2486419 RepID=UPI001F2F8B2F|nr:hypothetical protein [Mesobaculum littorinae]